MSVLPKIAYFQNRRDEVPNQELARELVGTQNSEGIREIAENLWNKDGNVQNDCIKVLYEIGEVQPELIAAYTGDFIKLLKSKKNRLVWGAMTALATIAKVNSEEIYGRLDQIYTAMETGSVITIDNGIKTLALIAVTNPEYNQRIFPFLLNHLRTCRPKEVPQHAEKTMVAVNSQNKDKFLEVLQERQSDLTASQMVKIKKIFKDIAKIGQDDEWT
jgi:hypothetical protein